MSYLAHPKRGEYAVSTAKEVDGCPGGPFSLIGWDLSTLTLKLYAFNDLGEKPSLLLKSLSRGCGRKPRAWGVPKP